MSTVKSPGRHEPVVRAGLIALGVASVAIGLFQALDPPGFVRHVGPYGAPNGHYVRDLATWSLAYGLALLLAAGRPGWRRPLLFLGIAQTVLHLANHIADVGDADPAWLGWADAVAIALSLGAMAWLWRACATERAS